MQRLESLFQKPAVCLLLLLLCLIPFLPGTSGTYVHDDVLLIETHPYVTKGIAGIPGILTQDSYISIYEDGQSSLNTGRYRPLSLVTFAVEQSISPQNAGLQRIVNLLLYALLGLAIFCFLRRWFFPDQPFIPFLITAIFLLHPLHAEVVANIKSRDEILSLLFIIAAFHLSLKLSHATAKADQIRTAGLLALSLLLALLSKEYAITLVILVPALLWVKQRPLSLRLLAPALLVPLALYIGMRLNATSLRIIDVAPSLTLQPWLKATPVEALATKLELLGLYLVRLFWPQPMSYNHAFIQLPYRSFASIGPWLALAVYIPLSLATLYGIFRRKRWGRLAFPWLLFLGFLAPISNLFLDVGTPFADRLPFHASLGFAWGLVLLASRIRLLPALAILCALLLPLAAWRVFDRTSDWQTPEKLFLADLDRAPYSPIVLSNAASQHLGNEDPEQALPLLDRALSAHDHYPDAHINRAVAHSQLGNIEAAEEDLRRVSILRPGHEQVQKLNELLAGMYYYNGILVGKKGDNETALRHLQRAYKLGDRSYALHYALGGVELERGNIKDATYLFGQAASKAPKHYKQWSGFEDVPLPTLKPAGQ